MKALPGKYQHIAVFVTSAFILSLAQLHKQIYNPGVNGLEVTSLVCTVSDGLKIKQKGD
jgi:hypothetical protein